MGTGIPGVVANRVALEACVKARNEGRDLAREVALEACVKARNEGRDLAREGNEIIREASKWSPKLAAACEYVQPCVAILTDHVVEMGVDVYMIDGIVVVWIYGSDGLLVRLKSLDCGQVLSCKMLWLGNLEEDSVIVDLEGLIVRVAILVYGLVSLLYILVLR
ncbi:hypothetical protein HAX54_024731, partial [Datura stramonium]|nr:hypothetical protein [Datura stramonium]